MVWRALLMGVLFVAGGCTTSVTEDEGGAADASDFYPRKPAAKFYSYSRAGPDGTKLQGSLTILIVKVEPPRPDSPHLTMRGLIHFEADALVFSPEQGKAIQPAAQWPEDRTRYPMEVKGRDELYAFAAAIKSDALTDPGDMAIFWGDGLRNYLGMYKRPTQFDVSSVERPSGSDGSMSVRGQFRDGNTRLGEFLFSFRKERGLTGITARLPDGSIVALMERAVERRPPRLPPEDEEPDEEAPTINVQLAQWRRLAGW